MIFTNSILKAERSNAPYIDRAHDNVNTLEKGRQYKILYMQQEKWEKLEHKPNNFGEVATLFNQ